jgi:hypothetical protein
VDAAADDEPPLFDSALADEFAGLLGQAPADGQLTFESTTGPPGMATWETSGWLTDDSYAPDPVDPAGVASPPAPDEESVREEVAAADADLDDMGWDGPPAMLEDGSPPWLQGPDAVRDSPRGRPGRLVLQAILWVLAGIALGAAAWAVMALLGESNLFAAAWDWGTGAEVTAPQVGVV